MDFKEFLDKQEGIYTKFEAAKNPELGSIFTEGLKKHSLSSKGVYLIAFRHQDEISHIVESYSRKVSDIAPSMIYAAKDIHTTISDYGGPRMEFEPNRDTLERLSLAVSDALSNTSLSNFPMIYYDAILGNSDTIILKGNPDETFLYLSSAIVNGKGTKDQGLELKMPWGSHITLGRINESTKDKNILDSYIKYLGKDISLHSFMHKIDIGHLKFSDDGSSVNFEVFDSYNLHYD